MLTRMNAILAAAVAAAFMAAAVGSASAGNLSLSNRTFRVTWSALEFKETSLGTLIRCPVTFEGSFHSATIKKVSSALVGYVTRAPLASSACTTGLAEGASFLAESLPWRLTYDGFSGTLPNITRIKLRLFGKREFESVGTEGCIYHPQIMGLPVELAIGAGGAIASMEFEAAGILEKLAGGVACPPIIRDIGVGRYTALASSTLVSVRLI